MAKNRRKSSGDSPLFNEVTLTPNQKILHEKILNNTITFVYGPAGTSKTFTVCYAALQMLVSKQMDKIIITKPVEESGEKLGFLPGTVEEKIGPYFESFFGNMSEIIDPLYVQTLVKEESIQCRPLAHMRGATYNNSIMVLDEAQNCDFRQLMLFISRMGRDTKVVIAGDVSQYDIKQQLVALPKFIEMVGDIPSIAVHEFSKADIVRNPILIEITDRYEKWKHEKLTTGNKL
jgi:phosphate starvation-inducible PhoH-like protein